MWCGISFWYRVRSLFCTEIKIIVPFSHKVTKQVWAFWPWEGSQAGNMLRWFYICRLRSAMNITGWMKHWTACRKVSAMPDWRKMNGCRSSAISRWQIWWSHRIRHMALKSFYCIVWMKKRMPENCGQISWERTRYSFTCWKMMRRG